MRKEISGKRDADRHEYESLLANEVSDALCEAIGGTISDRRFEVEIGDGSRLDLLLTLDAESGAADFAVVSMRTAYPRDIQAAIWRLDTYTLAEGRRERLLIPLVAAEALSPGARELLRKRGIGYFERSGTLYVRNRNWVINIEKPVGRGVKREAKSLFTDAREMVVHALLMNRSEWLTGGELAELTDTSHYTCSMVLQELERLEWCETTGSGRTLRRKLAKPRELLNAWADAWKKRKEARSRWYVFNERSDRLLENLGEQIIHSTYAHSWAFTGTAAANAYSPLLTATPSAEIIVLPGHAEEMAKALNLKSADKGANVTFVERDGASLQFLQSGLVDDARVASPFILYLDLLDGRGRNKELAEHILDQLEI